MNSYIDSLLSISGTSTEFGLPKSRAWATLVDRFVKNGWSLHSISEQIDTESANGRFVLTVLAGLAQMEREQIGERTRVALAYKKANGERIGSVPYGWRLAEDGKTLVPCEKEAGVVRLIADLRASGNSLRRIAAHLNASGIPARGKRWHLTTVARIVRSLDGGGP